MTAMMQTAFLGSARLTAIFHNDTNGYIAAYSITTGATLMQATALDARFCSALESCEAGHNGFAVVVNRTDVYLLDGASGDTRWMWRATGAQRVHGPTASADGGSLYVGIGCDVCSTGAALVGLSIVSGVVTSTVSMTGGDDEVASRDFFPRFPYISPLVPFPPGQLIASTTVGVVDGNNIVMYAWSFVDILLGSGNEVAWEQCYYSYASPNVSSTPLALSADGSLLFTLHTDESTAITYVVAGALPDVVQNAGPPAFFPVAAVAGTLGAACALAALGAVMAWRRSHGSLARTVATAAERTSLLR